MQSIVKTYIKSLDAARSLQVLSAHKLGIKRQWPDFSQEERAALNAAGLAAKARIEALAAPAVPAAAPAPAPLAPVKDQPTDLLERAFFEASTLAYQLATTREEIYQVRQSVHERSRSLHLWQVRELFVSDIAALRRIQQSTATTVLPRTQLYLTAIEQAPDLQTYHEIMLEAVGYSIELERADSPDWWVLEDAFVLRWQELRQKIKHNAAQQNTLSL